MSRGRGFTVVELLLALSLAGMVMAAAIGVYSMLNTADRVSERQMDEDVQLAAAQSVVRRAMQSLLAGQDTLDPSALAGNGDADAANDGQDIATVQAVSQTHGRSMFEIFFEEPEPGVVTPVLEFVVTSPPMRLHQDSISRRSLLNSLASANDQLLEQDDEDDDSTNPIQTAMLEEELRQGNRLAETVRGRLEVVPHGEHWALQWRPVSPAGDPRILLTGITWLEWSVLPREAGVDGWQSVWAAFLRQDFPSAVRLILWTESGRHADWLFETQIAVAGR